MVNRYTRQSKSVCCITVEGYSDAAPEGKWSSKRAVLFPRANREWLFARKKAGDGTGVCQAIRHDLGGANIRMRDQQLRAVDVGRAQLA